MEKTVGGWMTLEKKHANRKSVIKGGKVKSEEPEETIARAMVEDWPNRGKRSRDDAEDLADFIDDE